MRTEDYPKLLSIADAAEVLGVSRNTAYQLADEFIRNRGESGLPNIRLGRLIRVPASGLRRFMDPGRPEGFRS